MTSRLISLVIHGNDTALLARFWAEALGWEVEVEPDDEIVLVPNDGTSFEVLFEPVPDVKVAKNPIHLDLTTSSEEDMADLIERLLAVGGRHLDIGQRPDEGHVVLADPEGNELCVIEPTNQFLAGRGRLGSITCDGSPAVGRFWRDVLGWDLFWDQDGETAIRTPDGTGPFITWGPPVPVKTAHNRLHLDVAPPAGEDQQAEVERLIALGARRADVGQGDVPWVVMADPDGNEFCVLTPR